MTKMLQADSVQFNFPPPPTLGEVVRAILLMWLIGLSLIASGAHFMRQERSNWLKLLAIVGLALGFFTCFLLGIPFTPLNYHHRFVWVIDNPAINYWIDFCLVLTVWGSAPFIFWAMRKRWKRKADQTEPNAN